MPKNGFLSKSTREPPRSSTVCAAERPARPPPTIITRSPDCDICVINLMNSKCCKTFTSPRFDF
jgi:hypothetical protein